MSGFLIRMFATNSLKDEIDGKVLQSEFLPSETKELWVRQVMAYEKIEGDLAKTPAGTWFSFEENALEVEIETKSIPFDNYSTIEELEQFFRRPYVYIATRWNNQPNYGRYPRAIPPEQNYAIRIACEEKSSNNDEGYLFYRIKGKIKKW